VALDTTTGGCIVVHLNRLGPLFVRVTALAVVRRDNMVGRFNRGSHPPRTVTGDAVLWRALEHTAGVARLTTEGLVGALQFKTCLQVVEWSLILFLRKGVPPASHQNQTQQGCADAPHICQNKKLHNRITSGDAADKFGASYLALLII